MTTLRDVAALAGVSAMTVSNVVNGREHKVSPATRERVRGAIETLGYVPNAQARTLAGSSSRIIALVYGAGDGLPALTASHESTFVGACECAARRAGYSLMLCGAHSDRPDEVVDRLRAWRVCGVICLGTVPPPVHPRLTRAEAPVVLVDSYSPQMVAAGGEVLGQYRRRWRCPTRRRAPRAPGPQARRLHRSGRPRLARGRGPTQRPERRIARRRRRGRGCGRPGGDRGGGELRLRSARRH